MTWTSVAAGDTVTYHHPDRGNVKATVVEFVAGGNANLSYGDGWTLRNVREGSLPNHWDAIPPRRFCTECGLGRVGHNDRDHDYEEGMP